MNNTNQTIAGCGFHHVAIRTYNWEKSLKFYCQGLGFVPRVEWGEAPDRAAMLDTGDGNYLEVFERPAAPNAEPSKGEPPLLHFCLRTDNCEAAVEAARRAGAEVTVETTVPEAFVPLGLKAKLAFVKGPDGEVVEFFESRDL